MKVLAMAIEIGFIDYRSRFHFEAFSIQQTSSERNSTCTVENFCLYQRVKFYPEHHR